MHGCNGKVFEVLSRKEEFFAPRPQTIDLGEAPGPVSESKVVAAEIWKRLAAVNETLQYVTLLYLEHVESVFNNIVMYTELRNSEKLFINNLQSPNFKDVWAAAWTILSCARNHKAGVSHQSRSRAIWTMKGHARDTNSEALVSLFMKIKDVIFGSSRFRFSGRCRINIIVPHTRVLLSMTLSQSNKQQYLLTNPARLPLINATSKWLRVLRVTIPAASMNLFKESQWTVAVMISVINSCFYTYDAYLADLKELHIADVGQELENCA